MGKCRCFGVTFYICTKLRAVVWTICVLAFELLFVLAFIPYASLNTENLRTLKNGKKTYSCPG